MSLAEARKLLDAENKAKEILARVSGKSTKQTVEASNKSVEKIKSISDKKYMDEHKHAQLLRPTLESMFDRVLTRKNLKVQKKVAQFETDFRPDFYIPEKKMFVVVFTIWTLYEEARATWKRNRRVANETAEEGIKIKWAVVDHFHNKTSYFVLPRTWYEWEFKELQYYCRHAKWKSGVDE